MRRFTPLAIVTIGLAVSLWLGLRAEPAQAGLVGATVTPFPTSAAIVADTDAGGVVYWCIVGYPIRKFYGTTSPTADCGAPSSDPERGWVLGGPVTSLQVKFSVPHLAPETNYTLTLSAWSIVPASEQNQLVTSVLTLSKLALTSGPTVTPPTRHLPASTVPVTWDTNRPSNSTVLSTTAGPSWRQSRSGSEIVYDIAHAGNSLAVAVGRGGFIARSVDGGGTWSTVSSPVSGELKGVAAADAYVLWAVGEAGVVLFSDDAGRTWVRLTSFGPFYNFSVAAPTPEVAIIASDDGRVFRTDDQGTSWTQLPTPVAFDLVGISAVDASTFWVVGDGGTILKTTNGGASWIDQSRPGRTFLGVSALNATAAIAVSTLGEVWRTNDGGASWTVQTSGNAVLYSAELVSALEGWAFGSNGTAVHSTDGNTWSNASVAASPAIFFGSSATTQNGVAAVGSEGRIHTYSPPYASVVSDGTFVTNHNLISLASLSCQTTYYFRVASDDALPGGNSVVASLDSTFATGACPDPDPPTVTFRPRNQWTPPATGPFVTSASLTVRGDATDPPGGTGLASVTLTHTRGPTTTTVPTDPALPLGSLTYAWSKTVTLARGLNTLSAHAVDVASNQNITDPVETVTLDGDDPTVTIDPPNNASRSIAVASLSISGTASDPTPGSGLASLTLRQNGAPAYTQTFAGNPASGTWSTTLTLTSGPNIIEVQATDAAGRLSAVQTVTITYDTGGPTISNLTPLDGVCLNSAPVPFFGAVTDTAGVASVTLQVNGTPVTTSLVSGGFTASISAPPLIKGVNTLNITATDTLGNPSTATHTLRYDPDPPLVSLTQPVSGSVVTVASQPIRGTASDPNAPPATFSCGLLGVEVQVETPPALPGAWQAVSAAADPWITVTLASGSNIVRARATDLANNRAVSDDVSVILDTSAPTNVEITEINGLPVPPVPTGPINVSVDTLTVRGTAQDNAAIQSITLERQGGTPTPVASPALPVTGSPATANWSGSVAGLQEGLNTIIVTVRDNASLTTTDRVDVVYTAPDTTPPVITPGSATSGTICSPPGTNVVFLEASWTTDEASDTAAVWHDLDAGTFGSILADPVPPGTLVHLVRVQPAVPNHQYEIYVSSRDAAGNAAAAHTFTVRAADSCDITDPNVTFLQPRNLATVSDVVTIEVEATDNRGVKEIEFFIDDISQGVVSCVGLATCRRSISWDTSAIVGPTNSVLRAVATDTSDRTGSGQITVTVDNTRPVITNVSNTNAVQSGGVWTVTVTWETNVGATSLVRYGRETSSGTYSYTDEVSDGAFLTSHSITLTNLAGNSIYHYQVESCDDRNRCSQG